MDAPFVEKEETASTNDDARELALGGAPEGTVVLARRQTRGRGRAGRAFASPDGGLYLSVVLRPDRPPREWGLVPLMAGTVVAAELRALGFDASVKWPNDVLVAGRKAGGVLVESRWGPAPFAVVGVGLNILEAPVPEATALAAHGTVQREGPAEGGRAPLDEPRPAGRGVAPERRALAARLAAALVARMARWRREGAAGVVAEASAACATLGRKVEWENRSGTAVGIAEDGALMVETEAGILRVVAGDVRLRVA